MVLISTLAVAFVTSSGRSAWYVGVLLLVVYATFALTLYLLPPPVAGCGPARRCPACDRPLSSTPDVRAWD